MLVKLNDLIYGDKPNFSGAKLNCSYTKKGPGRMPFNKGNSTTKKGK